MDHNSPRHLWCLFTRQPLINKKRKGQDFCAIISSLDSAEDDGNVMNFSSQKNHRNDRLARLDNFYTFKNMTYTNEPSLSCHQQRSVLSFQSQLNILIQKTHERHGIKSSNGNYVLKCGATFQ
jgi:hypothetical protein